MRAAARREMLGRMLYLAIGLAAVGAALIVFNGFSSASLVASAPVRKLVVFGALIAAVLSALAIFEAVAPAAAAGEGVLAKEGDEVAVGDVAGGILNLECRPIEGVKKTGSTLDVRLLVKGGDDKLLSRTQFRLGARESEDGATAEQLSANVAVGSLGADGTVRLTALNPKDKVTVWVAYRPHRFPLRLVLFALIGLCALAAIYEGMAPMGWRRTFLTAAVVGVTTFAWTLQDGLATHDGATAIAFRVVYGLMAGAVVGSLGPTLLSRWLPELEKAGGASEKAGADVS